MTTLKIADANSSVEYESTPAFFVYDEAYWVGVVKSIASAFDNPVVEGVQVSTALGTWATELGEEGTLLVGLPEGEELVAFDFDGCSAGWRDGMTTIQKFGPEYSVHVELYNKYSASDECWASFTVSLEASTDDDTN